MVNFVKPSVLGTQKEFMNLYANPIKYGQHKNSDEYDIKLINMRTFVLHKSLEPFVHVSFVLYKSFFLCSIFKKNIFFLFIKIIFIAH